MTSQVTSHPGPVFVAFADHRAGIGCFLCLVFCAACATNDDLRVGIGAHGSGQLLVEDTQRRDVDEGQSGLLIDGFRYDLRGRAADLCVSVGVPQLQAVGGVEWSRQGGEHFQAQLLGARTSLAQSGRFAGSYVSVLGRNVEGSESRTPFFDGFDLGLGYEAPLRGRLLGDVCMSWTYVDGDAIRVGMDSISELRLAFGLRFEF
jgi:hypothetical protein